MAKKRDENRTNKTLSKVNVKFATAGVSGNMTPEMLRGLVWNPVYSGMGPFPALIDDE